MIEFFAIVENAIKKIEQEKISTKIENELKKG